MVKPEMVGGARWWPVLQWPILRWAERAVEVLSRACRLVVWTEPGGGEAGPHQ